MVVEITKIRETLGLGLINQLAHLSGRDLFLGECSTQAVFRLADGRTLRFGVTDDDVSICPGRMWVDVY